MSCTVIPFSDVASRKCLGKKIDLLQRYIYSCQILAIVDPMGNVLQYDAWLFIYFVLSLGYPFSDERIEYLREEDDDIIKQPPLKNY